MDSVVFEGLMVWNIINRGLLLQTIQLPSKSKPKKGKNKLSTMTASPVQQTQSQLSTDNFQLYVVEKLNAMDSRLSKLDSIETKISEVSRQIGKIDT